MDSLRLCQKYNKPHFISSQTFPFNRACQVTDITHTDNFKYIVLTGIGSTMDERYGGLLVKYDFHVLMDEGGKCFPTIFNERLDSKLNEKESKDNFAKIALKKFITECIANKYTSIMKQYMDDMKKEDQ